MEIQSTYTDRLPSGPEFETKRLKGYHQSWLTKTKKGSNKSDENGLERVVRDLLVRIGSYVFHKGGDANDKKDIEMVSSLLSCDFKYILLVARFFSTDIHFAERIKEYKDYQEKLAEWETLSEEAKEETPMPEFKSSLPPHLFKFKYEYKDEEENKLSKDIEMELMLQDFNVIKPYFQEEEYEGVLNHKKQVSNLPLAGAELHWNMMDVKQENKYKDTVKEFDANIPLKWRTPCLKRPGDALPFNYDVTKLELIDIEIFRNDVFKKEGRVESNIDFPHPVTKDEVSVDVTTVAAFFFPSGVV